MLTGDNKQLKEKVDVLEGEVGFQMESMAELGGIIRQQKISIEVAKENERKYEQMVRVLEGRGR